MTNLLNDDATTYIDGYHERPRADVNTYTRTTEARLLRTVTLEGDPFRPILDVICSDRRMMRDLLYYEICLSSPVDVWPIAVE